CRANLWLLHLPHCPEWPIVTSLPAYRQRAHTQRAVCGCCDRAACAWTRDAQGRGRQARLSGLSRVRLRNRSYPSPVLPLDFFSFPAKRNGVKAIKQIGGNIVDVQSNVIVFNRTRQSLLSGLI